MLLSDVVPEGCMTCMKVKGRGQSIRTKGISFLSIVVKISEDMLINIIFRMNEDMIKDKEANFRQWRECMDLIYEWGD